MRFATQRLAFVTTAVSLVSIVAAFPTSAGDSVQVVLQPAPQQQSGDESVSHPSFPDHRLRLTEPTLCDPTVQQYSGYLDISDSKHLFFWFFESRSSPSEDPLVLWLNGGPGCSSATGLLFELGPCSLADEGNTTVPNPYSWNTRANMIFLDQPVGVGYSYTTDGSSVVTSADAAKDVYAFFELFMTRFPKYAKLPFHVAGESYAGRYIPHIASEINNNNKALASDPSLGLVPINLASIMIGNGLVDPLVQMTSVVEYACEGPYAIYDDPFNAECNALRKATPVCDKMIESCYKYESRLTCIPATAFCWTGIFGPIFSHGYNITGPHFSPPLISDGIRVLIYAGNADLMCNYMGETQFILGLENIYHDELSAAPTVPWLVNGVPVGEIRSAGNADSTAGNLTLAVIYEAGHMAPHDQPEATLDMMSKWINNITIAR
ncbi:peptidase S10 serine carboxypeptidase [Melanogaster broomeanus]|nr:peptidase S10 serine carboxypeptidase [Melanogaster broomeanus]